MVTPGPTHRPGAASSSEGTHAKHSSTAPAKALSYTREKKGSATRRMPAVKSCNALTGS